MTDSGFAERISQHIQPDGSVVIPPRIAAWLEDTCKLTADRRIRLRDTDPEAYIALAALHLSAISSDRGTDQVGEQQTTTQSEMWLTTKQAATALNVTDRCIRKWCATGQLHAEQVGARWLINRNSITIKNTAA